MTVTDPKRFLRVELTVKENDGEYGQVLARQSFVMPLPRSRRDIEQVVGFNAEGLITGYAMAAMSDAKLLADVIAGSAVAVPAVAPVNDEEADQDIPF